MSLSKCSCWLSVVDALPNLNLTCRNFQAAADALQAGALTPNKHAMRPKQKHLIDTTFDGRGCRARAKDDHQSSSSHDQGHPHFRAFNDKTASWLESDAGGTIGTHLRTFGLLTKTQTGYRVWGTLIRL
ncbi:hypothetical protein ABBQ38_015384 [Trebouxia sp. C0009 RCD-2024]